MEHKRYAIKKDDTLESIALEHKIDVEDLLNFHNANASITQQFFGSTIPIHINELILPVHSEKKSQNLSDTINFEQKARYRCEQINTSKVDGKTVHFVEQKFQYLLLQSLENRIAHVKLEEHLYNFNPAVLNLSFEFISKTEFIKNNVLCSLSESNGRVQEVLNKNEIQSEWKKFRDEDFEKSKFIQKLQQTNTKAVEDLKGLGDKQFSVDYKLAEEEYRRNLFYFCCFDSFLVKKTENILPEDFPFMSTIVPPVIVPIEFRYDKISEENGILKLRKVGTVKLNPELVSEIEKKYDEIHKPNIKYSFTEYKLEFRTRIEYNTEEKIIETADVFIMEQIADNIDNTCEFHLKKLENYVPSEDEKYERAQI